MTVDVDEVKKTLTVQQELTFFNESADTITSIVFNDWNNAYSDKNTPLAKRFSDEFVRSFHLAKDHERGSTKISAIKDKSGSDLIWERPDSHPDLVVLKVNGIYPGEKAVFYLNYIVKIPSDRFTKFGYTNDGGFNLRHWHLTPARFENHEFVRYSNQNLDDIANGISGYEIEMRYPAGLSLVSDLEIAENEIASDLKSASLKGSHRNSFNLIFEKKPVSFSFRNSMISVENGLKDSRVSDIRKAILVDRIVNYVKENVGEFPHQKITVTQADYERNPFYGLNQLPSFISPFPDEFIYEIKFLKTYLNNYLKASLTLDPRKDNWIYDGIQIYTMMKYIDEHHPESKMMGSLTNLRLLKSYNLINLSFNGQYSYFYMLMARRNLDQPIGDPKNTLIKFNEQIAGKYRAGLSFRYLDDYLQNDVVKKSIRTFYDASLKSQTSENQFISVLRGNSTENIDWFFGTIINSREIIDYVFEDVSKTADSVSFNLKSKTGTQVPIPVYGLKKGTIVFKEWIEKSADTTITVLRRDADKIVINYKNEVPEYNLRNNWRSLKEYSLNRPIKFNFMKDLEDPYYNQVMYVPTLTYNLYDGLSPGIRFHNKTILEKPFLYDLNPIFSTKKQSFTGSFLMAYTDNNRESRLYNTRYSASGNYFHYAPDAAYLRLNPMVTFRIRENDLRDNRNQLILLREVIVNRDKSNFVVDNSEENYAVFDAKYINSKTEATKHFRFMADVQASGKFGKAIAEIGYRKLFENNSQIDLRLYAGSFLYNKTESDFFSFALDRPTDYLFDYNYYGRSEATGFFSQQLIVAEGGFKSKLSTPYANQWITTLNAGVNIWNWIEAYGDVGLLKNRNTDPRFVYDSGIRLNLVTDYFELYFPVYSNNGWEIAQDNYDEKIRFIITLDPKVLVSLFTRKWF